MMGDHPYFPMFVSLSGKRVLVIGAGAIAARRIGALLPFGPRIDVVAPGAKPEVSAAAEAGRLRWQQRPFEPADLDGAELVLAATDDPALNARVAALCRERHVPVNVASDKALCDFFFPGIAMDGDLVVGVTASGKNHRRAREAAERIRENLEEGSL